ncbi:MAG: hypothetical protein KGV56_05490 [Gammaproteobacteria bacterium]|nr:hypothetical protein [Gammaproteobacteria bacterium]
MTSNNKKTSTNTDKLSVNLCNLTTFHTTAFAKQLIIIDRLSVLDDLPHRLENQDFIVLGSGSNVLFADDYQGIVVVNRLHGINIVQEDKSAIGNLNNYMKEAEKTAILSALAETDNDKIQAAEKLGISPVTFRNKLKKYNLQ